MKELKVHPLAAKFPMMSDEELADLAEDIKANGLHHPLIIDGDVLIDGRNRLAACKLAGVEPRFEELDGRDPIAYIINANTRRREMTKGQKAMAVAIAYPEPEKGGRGKKKNSSLSKEFSEARLSQARSVLRFSPELAASVFAGDTPLDQALKIVDEQQLQAQGNAARLDRLRKAAPDLAELVAEQRMSLSEATAAWSERETRRRDAYESGVRSARRLPGDIISSVVEIIGGTEARLETEAPILMSSSEMNQAEEMWSLLKKSLSNARADGTCIVSRPE